MLLLLRSQALASRLGCRFLLEVNILREFIQTDRNARHVEHFFSIWTEQRDFVFARRDAQRKILAFFVEFENVFAARIHT